MRLFSTSLLLAGITGSLISASWGQDLAPRAYIITPVHMNAVTLTYSFYDGNVTLDGALPVTDDTVKLSVPTYTLYHSFSFFGRSANAIAALPYGVGNFQGKVNGNQITLYRSGLLDSIFRLSVNLKGGPAMEAPEMRTWRQKTLIGASLKVVAPTGQYDPTKLVNLGANRWVFKPELAFSRRWGDWLFDAYGGAWLYTTNHDYFSPAGSPPKSQAESPIGSFETHLSYDVRPRLWASIDGNFWFGGRISVNGVEDAKTLERNSRVGVTGSVPVGKQQSLKFSYSRGAYIRYGGNFNNISIAWQYSWMGWPK